MDSENEYAGGFKWKKYHLEKQKRVKKQHYMY